VKNKAVKPQRGPVASYRLPVAGFADVAVLILHRTKKYDSTEAIRRYFVNEIDKSLTFLIYLEVLKAVIFFDLEQ
jgi:hypothetical protein